MKKLYQIIEYGSFTRNKDITGYQSLPGSTFDALEEFILANQSEDTNALDIMSISSRKGIGKIITAKNYVGLISMKDGTHIEILPKTTSQDSHSLSNNKKLLVNMLKTLRHAPYKTFQSTNVNYDHTSIFEIFIRMYIDEIFSIVKIGLKSSYEMIESNETFFKGKMMFNQQIKYNYAHKERSYMEYDVFNTNRSENKIIKATLQYLYKITYTNRNKKDIKTLLSCFHDIDDIYDYNSEFDKVIINRGTKSYINAMEWSKVFLTGKSFTTFSGTKAAFALLFPMEVLFESYITHKLRRALDPKVYKLVSQDRTYHLFDTPRMFSLRPDIVITNISDQSVYVMDTKWKVLSNKKANYGISQSDMYQMYAYQKKYNAKSVTLIYPLVEGFSSGDELTLESKDGVIVKVMFVDLFSINDSLEHIIVRLNS